MVIKSVGCRLHDHPQYGYNYNYRNDEERKRKTHIKTRIMVIIPKRMDHVNRTFFSGIHWPYIADKQHK